MSLAFERTLLKILPSSMKSNLPQYVNLMSMRNFARALKSRHCLPRSTCANKHETVRHSTAQPHQACELPADAHAATLRI
eukprot:3761663-Pleurochrysis_carterae.AAC.2